MWFLIFFVCIFVAINSGEIREEIGTFVWGQWLVIGGLLFYMVLSWLL
jgi:hypothetical protein|nr:MAG: hypothetical protein [Caudoviricetes sp.]